MNQEKKAIYDKAEKIWNPNKIATFRQFGIEMVLGERTGYVFQELDGREIINMHINGGVFNLGHCNEEIKQALVKGAQTVDAGNHYFPSQIKNDFCEALLNVSPESMQYVALLNGGGEAIDAAVKFARHATKRKKVVSMNGSFHGGTGIAMEAGHDAISAFFNMTPDPSLYTKVDYNNLEQLEEALKQNDVACVLLESIPATFGFPIPDDDYLRGVEMLCHRHGALFVSDEIQTGLMRSGSMWCAVGYGATPDIIVTGKGLSGGYYPMSAVIMNEKAGAWLKEDGFAHVASFMGTELGCIVGTKVIEITSRPSTKENVDLLTDVFAKGLSEIQKRHADFLVGFRQRGVIMGLETPMPDATNALMASLYRNGVWAIRANFDQRVLQFKAGLLMEPSLAEKVLDILDTSIGQAKEMIAKHMAM